MINELFVFSQNYRLSRTQVKINEKQDITLESALLHDDEKIPDLQLEEEQSKLEKENDEMNISYHHEDEQKQKIKEKEYGD